MAGKTITEADIRRKVEITAERLFRSGLSKVEAGDLTQAAADLELAVRYDKYHMNARNLLGMVRFQTGEIGEALKQWGISEHLHTNENPASRYMDDLRGEVSLLSAMSDAVVMYNEALDLAAKGEYDFALLRLKRAVKESPSFIKAQLLLCAIYMETSAYQAALGVLDEVAKIDPLNPDAMKYRLHIAAQQKEGAEDMTVNIRDLSNDLFVQNALPEPEMKHISSRAASRKVARSARGFGMQILLLLLGLVLGIELMALLYVPGKLSSSESQARSDRMSIMELQDENSSLREQLRILQVPINEE